MEHLDFLWPLHQMLTRVSYKLCNQVNGRGQGACRQTGIFSWTIVHVPSAQVVLYIKHEIQVISATFPTWYPKSPDASYDKCCRSNFQTS